MKIKKSRKMIVFARDSIAQESLIGFYRGRTKEEKIKDLPI